MWKSFQHFHACRLEVQCDFIQTQLFVIVYMTTLLGTCFHFTVFKLADLNLVDQVKGA